MSYLFWIKKQWRNTLLTVWVFSVQNHHIGAPNLRQTNSPTVDYEELSNGGRTSKLKPYVCHNISQL